MRPDVPAVDRAFDYLVPDEFEPRVRVGAIVRVPLHGRRVRGWVVADGVEPETGPELLLLPVAKVVGAGPPPELVALAEWAAWRWAGSMTALLRAASPATVISDDAGPADGSDGARPEVAVFPAASGVPAEATAASSRPVSLVAWPPTADRRALVAGLLAPEGSSIVVAPDSRRALALVRDLERAGRRAVVMHAEQPARARSAAWSAARAGACVVVGGRVAVWAPVPDLRAVVVLDHDDESLKEERVPAWHARDVALERARRAGARVTLVSPVVSLEAQTEAGPPLRPARSFERAGWPLLEVVDRRETTPGVGLLTEPLAGALHRALDGGRAVCVLNRKGRARLLACAACHELARCERCGAAVAESANDPTTLTCARCDAARPRVCAHCHGTRLRVVRAGVTRVRDELAALLPRSAVSEVEAKTREVPASADVFVGTEAVLHRVPRVRDRPVRLVAYLDFDQELLAPRIRAAEQALWLLVRGARLVGPRDRGGRLLAQTRVPEHPVLEAVRHADPARVAASERAGREELGLPPFGALAELSGETAAVTELTALLRSHAVTVLGPSAAPASRRGPADRVAALAKAPTVTELCDALAAAAPMARALGRLRIEVDPLRV